MERIIELRDLIILLFSSWNIYVNVIVWILTISLFLYLFYNVPLTALIFILHLLFEPINYIFVICTIILEVFLIVWRNLILEKREDLKRFRWETIFWFHTGWLEEVKSTYYFYYLFIILEKINKKHNN